RGEAGGASGTRIVWANGYLCRRARANWVGSLAPASARQAVIRFSSRLERPAWSRHSSVAAMTAIMAVLKPSRMFAGPVTASASRAAEGAHSRARHRVPPPSTPRRIVSVGMLNTANDNAEERYMVESAVV